MLVNIAEKTNAKLNNDGLEAVFTYFNKIFITIHKTDKNTNWTNKTITDTKIGKQYNYTQYTTLIDYQQHNNGNKK